QQNMNDLVGIIREGFELLRSLARIEEFKNRAAKLSVEGHRQFNPGWHLALDLRNMLLVSECIARAALEREESRGGHTRNDFPATSVEWGAVNLMVTINKAGDGVDLERQALPVMPDDLKGLFEIQGVDTTGAAK
ncbi:MAG: fumarate reductase/succinate dehydrogenase flavoprotein subunit, partial [Nocardioides sp.]